MIDKCVPYACVQWLFAGAGVVRENKNVFVGIRRGAVDETRTSEFLGVPETNYGNFTELRVSTPVPRTVACTNGIVLCVRAKCDIKPSTAIIIIIIRVLYVI